MTRKRTKAMQKVLKEAEIDAAVFKVAKQHIQGKPVRNILQLITAEVKITEDQAVESLVRLYGQTV